MEQTGSIGRSGGDRTDHAAAAAAAAAAAIQPSEADLAYARAAAADVLTRAAKDNSVPWQNPQTGAGGNITPLASSYSEGGLRCRDFLASYVRGESQAWLQGAACRSSRGEWEVKSLKPLKSG
ncbi:MAG: RT0821/Lpp0805 family surface protein [Xanthobacteraceae bacterium]